MAGRWSLTLPILFLLAYVIFKALRRAPLPPGPRGRFPLLGMTFDMPSGPPWLAFHRWIDQYGPLVHYRVGLQDFILIGSGDINQELLSKRAKNYSNRPPSKVGQLISDNSRLVLRPYGKPWQRIRRVFMNVLTQKKCDSYTPLIEAEAIWSLLKIRDTPAEYSEELHRFSQSVARRIAFGQRVVSPDDPFVDKTAKFMDNFSNVMAPGRFLFESIPALLYLPRSWQPWMDEIEAVRRFEYQWSFDNYQSAIKLSEKYPDRPCVAVDARRELKEVGIDDEQQAAFICMELLGAGSETTVASLTWFIMACLTHPATVKRAHEELDKVIGQDRFPTWEDEPNLPYIRAMIKEQHRWRTAAPTSFAHYAGEEDELMGYRIPKGSVIRSVTWAMHKDEARYPSPDEYMPERFLDFTLSASAYANSSDVDSRDHFTFGEGKRICPGIHLAERSLFSLVSRLLHTFNIVRTKDSQGNTVTPDPDAVRAGLVMSALPFPAQFEVRSEKMDRLLTREFAEKFPDVK